MGKNKKSLLDIDVKHSLNDESHSQSDADELNVQSEFLEEKQFDPHIEQLISKQTASALLYLLFYSILMFTMPFGAYFGTRHLLEIYTDYSSSTIMMLSVVSSVITVYSIIGLYAWHAYHEKDIQIGENQKSANTSTNEKKKKIKPKKL